MSRIHKSLLALACVVIWCGVAFGASSPKYQMRDMARPRVDARSYVLPQANNGFARGFDRSVGAAANPNAKQMGTTYYDYQHNASTGRQVDEFNGKVEVSWMKAPGASVSIRSINWNRTNVNGAVGSVNAGYVPLANALLATGQQFDAVRPGYTNMRMRAGGKNVTIYHDAPESGGVQFWEARLDLSAGNGVFAGTPSQSPNAPGADHVSDGVIWPKSAISTCGTDQVHHGVGTWSGGANEVWYWRGIINDGAGTISWAAMPGGIPVKLDPVSAGVSAVVEASATGGKVAVVLGKQVNTTNADVIYYPSTDCGVTFGSAVNITNYSASGSEGFFSEINAVYDPGGELHIIWNTAPASGAHVPINLWHWSPTTGIRLITSAGWTNTCVGGTITNIGANNGSGVANEALAEPALSVKPAGVYGVAELMYATWVQFGPTDTDCGTVDAVGTLGGHVNGEIYVSVSSNDGLTWDRPQNVTKTSSPDCLPGNCQSEGWVTAAATADSGLYLSYVNDTHAGPAIQGGGAWSESPYMALAVEARAPVLEPVIAVSPVKYIELNANPAGGNSIADLNIISVGNADLTYLVEVTNTGGGLSHVLVNNGPTYGNTILAGGAPNVVQVKFDCLGLTNPSEHNWQLKVTSNDKQNDPGQGGSPIFVDMQVFAASPWYPCVDTVLSTGTHKMTVSSCLEMGKKGTEGTGFYDNGNKADFLYSGSPVVSLIRNNDTLAFNNVFMGLQDRTREQNKSFRAQGPMTVQNNVLLTVGDSTYLADRATGRATTTDTTIELNYEMIYPKPAHLSHGFVWKIKARSLTGSPITGVQLGAAADIDVPPSTGENGGLGYKDSGYVAVRGGKSDDAGNFVPNDSIMAFFYLPQGSGCSRNGAAAAQILSNDIYVYPTNMYMVDSLYRLFKSFGQLGSWGTNIYKGNKPDTNLMDLSAMLVTNYNATLSPTDTTRWGFGVAVSYLGPSDLYATIQALRAATHAPCQVACLITLPGDVNISNTITSADIITLVNFVFKGGVAPKPCTANGDVNCSGTVTSADIITLVNFVFKGGNAPCDICANSPLAASCN